VCLIRFAKIVKGIKKYFIKLLAKKSLYISALGFRITISGERRQQLRFKDTKQ
jgi:hypothetical protein